MRPLSYGWFKRQKRRIRRPTLHLSNKPPFLAIRDNRGTNTIKQSKSVPHFRPSPIIHDNLDYPEHFTEPKIPIDEKFPRLPDYPFPFEETGKRRKVPRLSNGYKKYPTSLNDLPKHDFLQGGVSKRVPLLTRPDGSYRYSKYPTSLNDLPKGNFPQTFHNGNQGAPQFHHESAPEFPSYPVPFRENYPKLPPLRDIPKNVYPSVSPPKDIGHFKPHLGQISH